MNRMIWRLIGCLTLLAQVAWSQPLPENTPKVFAIIAAPFPSHSRKIVSISPDGIKDIADLEGYVLYGADEETAVFLQTPANGPGSGSRLLVLDRKTSAIITDKIVSGIDPEIMMLPIESVLAVRSSDATVYLPTYDNKYVFGVASINWKTGAIRQLSLPFDEAAKRYAIESLGSVPSGIAVKRGPFLTIFDPATLGAVLNLESKTGPDMVVHSSYYPVPGFGLIESAVGMFRRVTEKDFSTPIPNPAAFPNGEINRPRFDGRLGWELQGKPCLIWGENEPGTNQPSQTMSTIAIYDLAAHKVILRQPLGAGVPLGFLPDQAGKRIYFFNAKKEILCLNLETQSLSTFAHLAPGSVDGWIWAN